MSVSGRGTMPKNCETDAAAWVEAVWPGEYAEDRCSFERLKNEKESRCSKTGGGGETRRTPQSKARETALQSRKSRPQKWADPRGLEPHSPGES